MEVVWRVGVGALIGSSWDAGLGLVWGAVQGGEASDIVAMYLYWWECGRGYFAILVDFERVERGLVERTTYGHQFIACHVGAMGWFLQVIGSVEERERKLHWYQSCHLGGAASVSTFALNPAFFASSLSGSQPTLN